MSDENGSNREIFSYFNGRKYVKCDPMRIEANYRRACLKVDINYIMDRFLGPDWLGDPEKTKEQGVSDEGVMIALQEQRDATDELIPVLCETFNVKHVDDDQENGMTYSEILDAFTSYHKFINDVKKNTDSSPGSQPPTDHPSPTTTRPESATTTTPTAPPGSGRSRSPAPSISP